MAIGNKNRSLKAWELLAIGIACQIAYRLIGGMVGSLVAVVGYVFILFAIIRFFAKPKHNEIPETELTLEQMALYTAQNLDEKFNRTDDDSMKKIVHETDRAGTQYLLEQAKDSLQDKYAKWFMKEAQHALQKDPQCVELISTVNSCLAYVGKNGTPDVFINMTPFEILHTLYIATLDHYKQQPYYKVVQSD